MFETVTAQRARWLPLPIWGEGGGEGEGEGVIGSSIDPNPLTPPLSPPGRGSRPSSLPGRSPSPPSLNNEHDRARRLARLDVGVGARRVRERIGPADLDLDPAGQHHREQ